MEQKLYAKFECVHLNRYFLTLHGFHLQPASRHVMWQYLTYCCPRMFAISSVILAQTRNIH